ncbi:hypothetical protein D5R93_05840 [Actinomyces lilanjuaniae]|uniref:Uncharacterized protein n=1 Tax=Actinomyces lilanjuaniae TaxID=2321394 RepID=A0ABM6Z349_9ACTO|nr:hypothetical protein [Actinomyces lilanjuaniae]AYD89690.1 hypothetical protein D5R93_05840 [Actinomyces lilanjuaniae]
MRAVVTVTTPVLGETTLTLETSDPAGEPVGRSDAVAAWGREVRGSLVLLNAAASGVRSVLAAADPALGSPASAAGPGSSGTEVPGAAEALAVVSRHPCALPRHASRPEPGAGDGGVPSGPRLVGDHSTPEVGR